MDYLSEGVLPLIRFTFEVGFSWRGLHGEGTSQRITL
jgi:hypothetical protein